MTLRTAGSRAARGLMQRGVGVFLVLLAAPSLVRADAGTPIDASSVPPDGGGFMPGTAGTGGTGGSGGSTTGGFANTGGNGFPNAPDGGFANTGGNGSEPTADGNGSDQSATGGSNEGSSPTAACSCQTNQGEGARRIHLCTGSFDAEVCDALDCEIRLRKASCDDDSPVRLCCEMEARKLYTYLYADCTHPNCDKGFRAQCKDFAGEVRDGMCSGPPPDPQLSENNGSSPSSCRNAIAHSEDTSSAQGLFWLLTVGLIARRTRTRRRPQTSRGDLG